MAAYFGDEFEEFRARALSGGSLPSIAQLREAAAGPAPATGSSSTGDDAASRLSLHSLTLSPSTPLSCYTASGRRLAHTATGGSLSVDHATPTHSHSHSRLLVGGDSATGGACSGVPTVILDDVGDDDYEDNDDEDDASEAETDTTLIEGMVDTGVQEGETTKRTRIVPGCPLVYSPQHLQQRHSMDSRSTHAVSSKDIADKTGDKAHQESAMAAPSEQAGERILCHMPWVMLEDDDWSLGEMRPRVSSMPVQTLQRSPIRKVPSPLAAQAASRGAVPPQHKVRSFAITSKGVVSKGEVIIAGSSSNSVASNDSESTTQSNNSGDMPSYRVMVSGEAGVGKRALVHSFRCPDMDPIATASFDDDDDADHTVSILLDDEESTLEFIDITKQEVSGPLADGDCYIVVYSVEWRHSFEVAFDQLREVRENVDRPVAIILVANKADLVRSRVVGEQEGRSAAKKYDCKYIEVSAAIDHRVDDLLVGILKQIRLTKQKADKMHAAKSRGHRHRPVHRPDDTCCHLLRAQHSMLSKLFRGDVMTSKSCENLYEL